MSYVIFDIDHETETITFCLPAIKGIASTKNNRLKSFEPETEKDIDIYLDSDNWDIDSTELYGCDPLEFAGDCY